jgi:hypothetical protein
MHFRPTSASRLNMVERIFRDITAWRPAGLKTTSTAANDIKVAPSMARSPAPSTTSDSRRR